LFLRIPDGKPLRTFPGIALVTNIVPKRKTHLSKLARHAGALFREQRREQFGAICYRKTADDGSCEALLIAARGSKRWVIPKGGPMKNRSLRKLQREKRSRKPV